MRKTQILLMLFCLVAAEVASNTALGQETENNSMTLKERRMKRLMSEVSLPMVNGPMDQEPSFLKSKTGNAVVVYGQTVKELETNRTLLSIRGSGPFRVEAHDCAAGASNYVMCAVTLVRDIEKTKTNKDGKKVTYTIQERKLVIQDSNGNNSTIAQGKDLPSGKGSYSIKTQGAYVHSQSGRFAFYVERIPKVIKTEKGTRIQYESKHRVWNESQPRAFKVGFKRIASRSSGSGRHNPSLQFVEVGSDLCMAYATSPGHGHIAFGCLRGGGWKAIATNSMYDFRLVQANDGWTYLFYYSHKSDAMEIVTSRGALSEWTAVGGIPDLHPRITNRHPNAVDSPESGWQLEADSFGKTAYAVYYFFRNSYHKGLRIAELEGGKLKQDPYTVVREKFFNTGWHPRFTITATGKVWLTYWDRVLKQNRVWSKLDSPEQLTDHRLTEEDMRWERKHKKAFVQAGAGAWHTMWNLTDISPPPDDLDSVSISNTSYSLSNTTLLVSSVEAELGGVNLGLSYAKSIMKDAKDAATDQIATGNDLVDDSVGRLAGSIKIEKLFPGHDVKAQFIWGRYRGSAYAGDGVRNEQTNRPCSGSNCPGLAIETDYIDAQALFLNKWRLKTGLSYTRYTLPMVLHTFYVRPQQTEYNYGGSYFRDVQVDSLKLLFGYSSLDYVAKYENQFNNLFLDATIDAGLAMLRLNEPIYINNDDIDSLATLDARLNLTFGYLLFKRWYNIRGFGIYLRPSYVAEGSFLGIPIKPKDRDENDDDIDEDDSYISPGVLSVRHGPWLDIGIVF